MADRLILSARHWPRDWTFVLHCRYGAGAIEPTILSLATEQNERSNVVISHYNVEGPTDLGKIFASVALGLAFYEPTYNSKYDGKNIRHIGLSSGKIATYLQHGVPVACNEIGEMADLIRRFNVGIVADAPEQLPSLLDSFTFENMNENCLKFFEEYLALDQKCENVIRGDRAQQGVN